MFTAVLVVVSTVAILFFFKHTYESYMPAVCRIDYEREGDDEDDDDALVFCFFSRVNNSKMTTRKYS